MGINCRTAHRTDIGLVRTHNEDHVSVVQGGDGCSTLSVVADGLGGHAAGEVASEIAVSEVMDAYRRNGRPDIDGLLGDGIRAAHERILAQARENAQLQGMGTTCTALAVDAGKMYIAHVGDSRAYRLRERLEQLTRDHTVAQELVDEKIIHPAEADMHPAAHVLTRALGMEEPLRIDILSPPEEVLAGDRYLICSDGLTGQVSDSEIRDVLSSMPPEDACAELVRRACNAGGPDNISVAVVFVDPD